MILNIDIDIVEVIKKKDKINSFTPTLAMSFASDMIVMMLSTFCYTGVSMQTQTSGKSDKEIGDERAVLGFLSDADTYTCQR